MSLVVEGPLVGKTCITGLLPVVCDATASRKFFPVHYLGIAFGRILVKVHLEAKAVSQDFYYDSWGVMLYCFQGLVPG